MRLTSKITNMQNGRKWKQCMDMDRRRWRRDGKEKKKKHVKGIYKGNICCDTEQ